MVDCNSYKVQQGDTLSGIADWFNVSWKDLQRINGIDDPDQISVGQLLQLSTNRSVCTAYSVKEGDTLSQIGQRYGVRWTPQFTTDLLAESLQDAVRHRDGAQRVPLTNGVGSAVFANDISK